jgi:chromate transporter
MDLLAAATTLLGQLAVLSLVSIGGAHSVLPDIYRVVVTEHAWMTGAQFATLVALGQAAPGPNVLVIALVGQQIGGALLGVAAICAFVLPSSVLAYFVARADVKAAGSAWMAALKDGLAPVTVGLVLASGFVLVTGTGGGWPIHAVAAAAAILTATTRLSPLWLIGIGALVGVMT